MTKIQVLQIQRVNTRAYFRDIEYLKYNHARTKESLDVVVERIQRTRYELLAQTNLKFSRRKSCSWHKNPYW